MDNFASFILPSLIDISIFLLLASSSFLNLFYLPFSFKFYFTSVYRYRKVAYLDTDVGQPEFTPPGFVSLTLVDKLTPGNYLWF